MPISSLFWHCKESLFSLYGSGKTTGLIIDSGYSTSSVVPIIDGYCHNYAHLISLDGAIDVNYRISQILNKKYPKKTFDDDIIEEIKINRNRVRNYGEKYSSGSNSLQGYEINYDLPDGS